MSGEMELRVDAADNNVVVVAVDGTDVMREAVDLNRDAEVTAMAEQIHASFPGLAADRAKAELLALAKDEGPAREQSKPITWSEPSELPDELPPVAPYASDLLPSSIGAAVDDIAERMQCPPDYPAASILVAMAAVVGCRLGIRPRRRDNWLVVPNLWGCVVGRPSMKKTPSTKVAEQQLRRIEARSRDEMADEIEEAGVDAMLFPERKKMLEISMRKALKEDDKEVARSYAAELKGLTEIKTPEPRRIVTTDPTIEKLAEMLTRHPAGMVLFVDELLGWMRKLDRDDQAGVRDQYNTLWNGIGRINIDRIGRGEIVVESPCISVFGCCTPGGLIEYVAAAVEGGRGNDGLVQRLQITVWPDSPKDYRLVDQWPDGPAKTRLRTTFDELADIDPAAIGEKDKYDEDGIPFLHFDTDGQKLFDDWDVAHNLRIKQDLPEAFESHLTKYMSMVPSIALLLHLADGGSGPVSGAATAAAIRWAKYLESHACRLYAVATSPERQHAVPLLRRLIEWPKEKPIRVAAIVKHGWSGLSSKKVVEESLELLAEYGWVRSVKAESGKAGGRPTDDWLVHPEAAKILATSAEQTPETPKTPPAVGFAEGLGGFDGSESRTLPEIGVDEIEVTI